MGLSTALFAGISGLERFQTSLDVIGNNVANVNTYGFKQQRVLFEDLLYDTLQSGTAPAGTNAGTNPSQLGAGVDISTIDTDFSDGELETTGIASDLAIEGNGFFVLENNGEQVYTRNGAFNLSSSRQLVNGAGMVVQGWNQTRDNAGNSTVNTGGAISDVIIPVGDNRIARATTEVTLNGNLNNAGSVAESGSILNSQRLFLSQTGDEEIASGAVDLNTVYIKDPAGGSDNVLLFQGSKADGTLDNGDQITVQLNKDARPLEAIFVYGQNDLVNNTSGDLGPDGTPDSGIESYDGTTLNDFLAWFDQAFGLISYEDVGSGSSTSAAHGLDGDNPNDLVDMGNSTATPETDETDKDGFQFVITKKIHTLSGSNDITNDVTTGVSSPKVGFLNADAEFNIIAGGNDDVTVGSSFVDVDGSGAYNPDKDIVLSGVESYVVTGNSTVTRGYVPDGSDNLILRSLPTEQGVIADGSDMYIDAGSDGQFTLGTDIVVKGAFSTDVFGVGGGTVINGATFDDSTASAPTLTVSSGTAGLTLSTTNITAGMSVFDGTNRFFVESVTSGTNSGEVVVTFDRADIGGFLAGLDGAANVTFMGAALVTAGYTATSSSGAGSTLITNINAPLGKKNALTNLWEGKSIYNTVADNEKGAAGSIFVDGDVNVKIETAPVAIAVTNIVDDGTSGNLTVTVADNTGLKTGMTVASDAGTVYTIDKIVGTVIHFDQADEAAGATFNLNGAVNTALFSGFAYLDSDNDSANDEPVFRIRNTMADDQTSTEGSVFIDIAENGDFSDTNQLTIASNSTIENYSSLEDNAVVFTDTATGDVHRKVPTAFDPTGTYVYKDVMNRGTYDEIRYRVLADPINLDTAAVTAAGYDVDNAVSWVLDEDFDGKVGADGRVESTVLSTSRLSNMSSDTIQVNMPDGSIINGINTQSSSIQIRGQIGSVNALSNISFISGTNSTERQIFASSTLSQSTGDFSLEVEANGESVTQNIVVYDSLGKSHDVNITFVLEEQENDTSTWRWFAETADASTEEGIFPVNDPRGLTPSVNVGTGTVVFDDLGRFLRNEPTAPIISIPLEGQGTDSALNITPDFSILTGFGADATGSQIDVREQDGYAQGVMDRFTVNADGTVTGIYTNGLTETVAQVALAAFANPDGLVRSGSSLFTVGSNSGNAMIGAALTGERGAIRGESLELSNVDITQEFTNMIVTQRAYQANARVVTKSDELLQELMQIIR